MGALVEDFRTAFLRRKKAIRRKGRVEFEFDDEWAEVWVRPASGVRVGLRILEGGIADVYLQRMIKPRRGRVLARLEGLRVPIAGARTVGCLEETIGLAAECQRGEVDEGVLKQKLRQVWTVLAFELV